jgi:hypothetical protein
MPLSEDEKDTPMDDFEEVVEEMKNPEPQEADLIDDSAFTDLLPNMTVNQAVEAKAEEPCIVSDEQLLGIYDEILKNCRDDRRYIDEVLTNFIDMVMNDGDCTAATKEGIVNLMKIRSDTSDKMSKVADLMTRIKLKDKDTFPRYLAAHQHNQVTIESSKRDLIRKIRHEIKKK